MKRIFFGKRYSPSDFGSLLAHFEVVSQDLIETNFVDFSFSKQDSCVNCFLFSSKKAVLSLQNSKVLLPLSAIILVVGNKTKTLLEQMGYTVFQMQSSARELVDWMLEFLPAQRVVHFCSDKALGIFSQKLGENKGWEYSQKIVYKTKELFPVLEQKFDALVFFSPSGVRSFVQDNSLQVAAIFSLGESTTLEIQKHQTKAKIFTSQENTFSDVLQLLEQNQGLF